MPPRPIKGLNVSSSDDSESPSHTTHGVVTSASEHYDDPNMTRIEVTHRRRSPKGSKKNKTGDKMASGFARPSSTHLLPKAKAKHYPVGKRVTMTMQPMADPDEAQDSNDGDEQDLDG